MKRYEIPEIDIMILSEDIIRTSEGTETPKLEESDGVWDLDL